MAGVFQQADRFGVSSNQIRELNGMPRGSHKIYAGRVLKIPVHFTAGLLYHLYLAAGYRKSYEEALRLLNNGTSKQKATAFEKLVAQAQIAMRIPPTGRINARTIDKYNNRYKKALLYYQEKQPAWSIELVKGMLKLVKAENELKHFKHPRNARYGPLFIDLVIRVQKALRVEGHKIDVNGIADGKTLYLGTVMLWKRKKTKEAVKNITDWITGFVTRHDRKKILDELKDAQKAGVIGSVMQGLKTMLPL